MELFVSVQSRSPVGKYGRYLSSVPNISLFLRINVEVKTSSGMKCSIGGLQGVEITYTNLNNPFKA